jgi:flagellar protein FlbD
MIVFTRLNQTAVAINPDLIERVEATPDTVITLVDDKKILVREAFEDVVNLITDYRAYVIARSATIEATEVPRPTLQLVPKPEVLSPEAVELGTSAVDDAVQRALGPGGDVIDYLAALDRDTEPD